jgi:hypothetical protein
VKPPCIYCLTAEADTRDHVPPGSLFPPDRRNNLITVPVCRSCNQQYALDDEYFRFAVAAPAYDHSEAARRVWDERIVPKVNRRPLLRSAIIKTLRRVEVRTPAGLYLGTAPAFKLEVRRVRRVVERIVRGLLWHHFEAVPAVGIEVATYINPAVPQPLMNILTTDLTLTGIGGDVFRYRYGRAIDGPDYSMWWLCFYTQTTFLTILGPPDAPPAH